MLYRVKVIKLRRLIMIRKRKMGKKKTERKKISWIGLLSFAPLSCEEVWMSM